MKENNQVKRSLKTRHLSMIALGGSIGTGLFVASGSAISTAGPGGALAAYLGIGIMVYFLMTSLGEMATYLPITGSFAEYSKRFVDPALGFAMGWNYWFNWAITLAVDLSTAALVLKFWFPHVPGWLFSLAALVIIFLINALSVKSFGEAEYWMALIKVITVIVFLIVGLLTIIGILGGHAVFLENFAYKKAPFVGGIPTVLSVFVVAGFSFQGTELIGITAGETENPEKSLPKAIKQVFWRILLFYILSIFVIACLIPYTSPNLLGSSASDITISPFTLVFRRAGLASAASVMNAVILTSVLSAANSGMYASTRMLFALGISGDAPKMFSRVNDRGIPVFALLGMRLRFFRVVFAIFQRLLCSAGPKRLYSYFDTLELYNNRRVLGKFFFGFFALLFCVRRALTCSARFLRTAASGCNARRASRSGPAASQNSPCSSACRAGRRSRSAPKAQRKALPGIYHRSTPPALRAAA